MKDSNVLHAMQDPAPNVQDAGVPPPFLSEDADPPFNRNAALMQVDGDEELLAELAKMLLGELPIQLAALREAVKQGDSKAIERTAHALKGAVGNFAARGSFDRARDLEMIGRAGDLAHAPEGLGALEESLQRLEPALARLVKTYE
ncbi:MAG TPA: Hpt domain-containing protein [Terriglobia bacterium]|nr:Hpt domain-containing protein [Terriglobia bacterium]